MKMKRLSLHRLCAALTAVGALSFTLPGDMAQANDDTNLPDTLRRGYVAPIVGPASDITYAHGKLGLIRQNFGRASLYVAWRLMHLPVNAVADESHTRKGDWVHGVFPAPASEDAIETWLQARSTVVELAPVVTPSYFRHSKMELAGIGQVNVETGQCGADAYVFATRTLQDLMADTSLKNSDRKAWVAAQDAVFARCEWTPESGPQPAFPAAPPARAPAKLKALYTYQHAAALFYSDDFVTARKEFDAVAAVPNHPMRAWATLGALRCIVRDAVHDAEWDAAVKDAWTKRHLRGTEFAAAVAEPEKRHWARSEAALKEILARQKTAKEDVTLASGHAAIDFTVRRAVMQLTPIIPLNIAMTSMDRADYNPYTMGTIDLFQRLYPNGPSYDRPQGAFADKLRQHEWFDFIITVQGCGDISHPVDTAICDAEHAHALTRWNATKDNAWLLATLMTARQPSPADLPAVDAARSVATDRPEWASLQFYAARVLRAQGRATDAHAAVTEVTKSQLIAPRDRALVEAEL